MLIDCAAIGSAYVVADVSAFEGESMQESQVIATVRGMEILDSRGNPTVSVNMSDGMFTVSAAVPSGASTGKHEALELRDGGKRFGGKGVLKAVQNVNGAIAGAISGFSPLRQTDIDRKMIALDGTPNKASLGANAILGVSMAATRLAAAQKHTELFSYFSGITGNKPLLPVPLLNVINGGVHAGGDLSVQEFLIVPAGFHSLREALTAAAEVYQSLKSELKSKHGASSTNVGDEGGFAPPFKTTIEALGAIRDAIEGAGYLAGKEIFLAIDAASSEFYRDGSYFLDGKRLSVGELTDFYLSIARDFQLISIEDPFDEESFDDFASLTRLAGKKLQIIGDDIYVTNTARIRKGIELKSSNAVLIKLNQIGTVTETLESTKMTMDAGMAAVVSHRSGETTDTFIADMSVGLANGQIKTGAPARGERVAKYNRLLEIEENHPEIPFPGLSAFRRELAE